MKTQYTPHTGSFLKWKRCPPGKESITFLWLLVPQMFHLISMQMSLSYCQESLFLSFFNLPDHCRYLQVTVDILVTLKPTYLSLVMLRLIRTFHCSIQIIGFRQEQFLKISNFICSCSKHIPVSSEILFPSYFLSSLSLLRYVGGFTKLLSNTCEDFNFFNFTHN